jgi:hypothetical protein
LHSVDKTGYPSLKRIGTQIGHGMVIGLSLMLVYLVQNLEEWDVAPFLTGRFGEVVPWITFSLITGAFVRLGYVLFDSRAVRSAGEVLTNLIAIVVTWRVFTVFPFDFSAYDFAWGVLVRIVLVVAIVGAGIAVALDIANAQSVRRR